MVTQACNCNSRTEARGGYLRVSGQRGLQSEFQPRLREKILPQTFKVTVASVTGTLGLNLNEEASI